MSLIVISDHTYSRHRREQEISWNDLQAALTCGSQTIHAAVHGNDMGMVLTIEFPSLSGFCGPVDNVKPTFPASVTEGFTEHDMRKRL